MAFSGVISIHQHAGLHRAVRQLQQEVTRPKARFEPTLSKLFRVDGGAMLMFLSFSCLGLNACLVVSPTGPGHNGHLQNQTERFWGDRGDGQRARLQL